jgi:hypothetical protein
LVLIGKWELQLKYEGDYEYDSTGLIPYAFPFEVEQSMVLELLKRQEI